MFQFSAIPLELRVLDLQTVSDRIEIADLLTRYTRAIDAGDWDRLDAVFTGTAHIDYSATGGTVGSFPEVKRWLADTLPMFFRRQHLLGQLEVDLRDDEAAVTAYFHNPMVLPQDGGPELLWEFGGLYRHRLVRTADGWRSRELVEELLWKRGI